jgi:gliding motility-associated-like protein
LEIYNRLGESVFETPDPDFKWDGIYNGKEMSTQLLVYYLQVQFTDQTLLNKNGNISLIR